MEPRELVRVMLLAAAALALLVQMSAQARAAGTAMARGAHGRSRQPLREGWRVKQLDTARPNVRDLTRAAAEPGPSWMPATMPAQVHDVLLAAGKIPDPRVGRNAAESAWVGERDWAYACTFVSPPGAGPVFLRFGGLDTLATAYLNGMKIGRFENMYRRYAAGVREHLRPPGQRNVLLIVFSSPLRYVRQARKRFGAAKGIPPHKHLRKCHSDFGSYLGARPHSVKVGVFRDVVLDVPDRAWLEDVWVRPVLSKDLARATVHVQVEAAGEAAAVRWRLRDPSRKEIARGETKPGAGSFHIAVDDPRPWWPRTHGKSDLYWLEVQLVLDGKVRDSRTAAFGIRSVRPILEDAATGEKRFAFEINGRRIFLRGACWAPLEGRTHCWSPDRAGRLLGLVEHGRMNVLRVWGEGHIPPREFYDECDRRGILIWQDFMFGYGMHPEGPGEFVENCRAEIEDMIRRLRNHPCLLLWCGGNENHMGWDFRYGTAAPAKGGLFGEIMPRAVARLDPGRPFHPSSPFGGRVPNWPLEGDWHDYTTLKFCPMASVPLFASEIGRVSAPSVSSLRRFLSAEELWPEGHDARIRTPGTPAWPAMWQYRSVGGSWDKIGPIEEFCDPASAEDLVRVLGSAHGQYLQRRIERQRRGVPDGAPDGVRRCWGNTIWRLNDAWPIVYWSAIDYYLEPKIPYYFLRRAYDPVLICFERTPDRIAVWVVNDSPEPVAGRLTLQQVRFDGTVRGRLACDVELRPGQSKRCLDATDLGPIHLRGEFLKATLGRRTATLLLTGERYLHLPKAKLSARWADGKVEVATNVFARQVSLEVPGATGAVFEDNFFDLPPGAKRTVRVVNAAGGKQVRVRAVNAGRAVARRRP